MSMLLGRVYELPLSRDYVRHWGVVEAVREICQNAIDSESPFEYSIGDGFLSITSRFAKLEPKTLLLGTTSKADATDKIGSFGEGYKIAMLVLTRENRKLTIFNGDLTWTPSFKMNKHFQEEILTIKESNYPEGRGKGLTFLIEDLSQSDIDQIIDMNMSMWKSIGNVIETTYGQILIDHPGKLFVAGLFVCNTEFKFGYNVKPEFLKLERDRQTVSTFDLAFLTKNMWFETKRFKEIAEHISNELPDLQYANYGTPDMVKEACYELFIDQHPGAVAASSQNELKNLIKQGLQRVVYIGGGAMYSCVTESKSYKSVTLVAVKTPHEWMHEWFKDNRGNMRRDAIVSFKELLEKSSDWRTK